MAEKNKVPVVAIRLIIQMRHDEYHNHSYKAIAERIKEEFDIKVTPQAVGYLYRKYKDEFSKPTMVDENLSKITKTKQLEFKPKPIIKEQRERTEFTQSSDEEFKKILKGEIV